MNKKAFDFLPMPGRSKKPRTNGLTMVIDTGLGYGYTEDLLKICADYIDLWKLGWATTQLEPLNIVKKKIDLLRAENISVSNGGTLLELSEHQGKAKQFFKELKEIGCDATEISNGSIDIKSERVCELVSMAKEFDLIVYCEVGKKTPSMDMDIAEYTFEIHEYLKAGAEKVIIEARESGASVGVMDDDGNPKTDDINEVLKGINVDNIIFEAPRKNQQVYFLKKFGPEISLGNIAPNDAISLETLRRGLRGDTVENFYNVIGDRHLIKHGIK